MFKLLSNPSKRIQRRGQRHPHFGVAHIRAANGFKEEAIVRDISEHGARLQFRAPRLVPDTVEIRIPKLGIEVEATVRWRSLNAFGVQFCSLKYDGGGDGAAIIRAPRFLSEPVRF